MRTIEINNCPCTLAEGFNRYSPFGRRLLFDGKRINHIIDYYSPENDDDSLEKFDLNRKHISIPGVHEKVSLVLDKVILRLTTEREVGQYILKPIPKDLKDREDTPANEHLTMQIAKQIYNIDTAANAMVFFKDGEPAYMTKRFDITPDGKKLGVEDFASIAGKTKAGTGNNFKYDYSYEELGMLIQKYVPAWKIEIEKYFSLVLFNYLFSNGDAHLKNFSLIETESGDYILSPAYDLKNTRLHINDNDFAFKKGLFADGYMSDVFKKQGHASHPDFAEFGKRIGIKEDRIKSLLEPFRTKNNNVESMAKRSFLSEKSKQTYIQLYFEKLKYLNGE